MLRRLLTGFSITNGRDHPCQLQRGCESFHHCLQQFPQGDTDLKFVPAPRAKASGLLRRLYRRNADIFNQ